MNCARIKAAAQDVGQSALEDSTDGGATGATFGRSPERDAAVEQRYNSATGSASSKMLYPSLVSPGFQHIDVPAGLETIPQKLLEWQRAGKLTDPIRSLMEGSSGRRLESGIRDRRQRQIGQGGHGSKDRRQGQDGVRRMSCSCTAGGKPLHQGVRVGAGEASHRLAGNGLAAKHCHTVRHTAGEEGIQICACEATLRNKVIAPVLASALASQIQHPRFVVEELERFLQGAAISARAEPRECACVAGSKAARWLNSAEENCMAKELRLARASETTKV